MKGIFPVKMCSFFAKWAFIAVLFSSSLHATNAPATVEWQETATTITLSNGKVRLVLNKKKATLDSLKSDGRELLPGASAGYLQIAFENNRDQTPMLWTCEVVRSSPELVEIAFVNTSRECPLEFSNHYILRAGDSGFYHFMTWGHDTVRTPGAVSLAQYNYALRIDPKIFTTSAVDDERISRFPAAGSLKKEQMVMDATYALPEGGYYSKYFNVAERDEKHRVHGAMSDDGLGLWVVMPSHEHLNGGPEHQELNVHQAGDSHVLLVHATAAHYGAGVISSFGQKGSWRKVSAPCFIYVNRGESQAALWADAKKKAELEEKAWPYAWLDAGAFQLKRGTVSGRIGFEDQTRVAGARVILAPHEAEESLLGWQQQWRGYRFYGWSDEIGVFEIGKVRPGLYDLFVWQPGMFGQFVKKALSVESGARTEVGELVWERPKGREQLWQIGRPDRLAGEFGYAENFRQWGLWDRIADATAKGVVFEVGKSTERDWPFLMGVTQSAEFAWRQAEWRVEFGCGEKRRGKAFLTIGLAGYEGRHGRLLVSLNGEKLGEVKDLVSDSAAHRSGIHGVYQEREIGFDASKLRAGRNTLTFSFPLAGTVVKKALGFPAEAVLWDAVRLEVQE